MRSFPRKNPCMRLLLAAFVLLLIAAVGGAYEPTSHYVTKDIEGWQVYIHRDLLPDGKHRDVGLKAIEVRFGQDKADGRRRPA